MPYVPSSPPSKPKINTKSSDASFTLPVQNAARGMVISWMLHKNRGKETRQKLGCRIEPIIIFAISNESIKIADQIITTFFSLTT